jgi:DNA-binding response OmpR family regulator
MHPAKKRILYIEDDRETASLLAEELADRGYEVSLAHNGRAGIDAILKDPPHLVLADINMPGISGFELLEQLTETQPRLPGIPFVFLTALADRESELRGWQLGADDYVTKPVDFEILGARIATRLARATPIPSALATEVNLAEREIETLTWVARGKTSAEIAQILGIAKRTVDFHVDNARNKLGVVTRSQAVAKAASGQLISP